MCTVFLPLVGAYAGNVQFSTTFCVIILLPRGLKVAEAKFALFLLFVVEMPLLPFLLAEAVAEIDANMPKDTAYVPFNTPPPTPPLPFPHFWREVVISVLHNLLLVCWGTSTCLHF